MHTAQTSLKLKVQCLGRVGYPYFSLQKDIQEKMRQRETEVGRNQLRQRDVERYRNRQMFITQIKHLTMKKYWLVRDAGTLCISTCSI